MRHGAFAIVLQRLLKALDRLAVVEPKQPVEARSNQICASGDDVVILRLYGPRSK